MAWVFPLSGHAEVREEGNRVGRREEVRCPMQSSDELERSAQWRPMRTFGAWHSRPWVDRGHRGDATTGARHSVKSKGTVPPETLELLGPDFVGDVGRFVYPIFTDRDGAPKSIGSGFLVRFDGFVCLITAAHVLDHIGATKICTGTRGLRSSAMWTDRACCRQCRPAGTGTTTVSTLAS